MPTLPNTESPLSSAGSQACLPWDDLPSPPTDPPGHAGRIPAGNSSEPVASTSRAPAALKHLHSFRPTPIFEHYWYFAAERQEIFHKRLLGRPAPWTLDPILSTYKFTNAYRASDRASQYLIRHVTYRDDLPAGCNELFFRIVLFKLFNSIRTWELLEAALGSITWDDFSFDVYDRIISHALADGRSIYSPAYIMPSGHRTWGYGRKHQNHLAMLQQMMKDEVPERLHSTGHMQEGFAILRSYPSIGSFLAYQLITDLNYSTLVDYSEMEFVVPGPGASSGIQKCFLDLEDVDPSHLIRAVTENQEEEFARRGLDFRSLWGRPLQLIDCQNIFCEVDKYTRVSDPDVIGRLGRKRIKHRYTANSKPITAWYPPSWGLNDMIQSSGKATGAQPCQVRTA